MSKIFSLKRGEAKDEGIILSFYSKTLISLFRMGLMASVQTGLIFMQVYLKLGLFLSVICDF